MTDGEGEAALALTGRRLAAIDPSLGFVTSVPEGEPGWVRLDEAIAEDSLEELGADILAETGNKATAASYLASRLTQPLVSRTVAAMMEDRRCPDAMPACVAMHRQGNKFDRVAFTGSCTAVAGDALETWWARNLAGALTPVFEASGAVMRTGPRRAWSLVATSIASTALKLDRRCGGCGEAGWIQALRLIEALGEHAPVRFARPVPLPLAFDGGTVWHTTKAVCCLKYLTKPFEDRATGAGYCSSCPLIDTELRLSRLSAKLRKES